MRLISKLLLGAVGAATLAGAAAAAGQQARILNLRLPDGSIARIRYVGDVPPKVIVLPRARMAVPVAFMAPRMAFPMPDFDRIAAAMDRRMALMERQAAALQTSSRAGGMRTISLRPLPPGTMQYRFVSTSDGKRTCSRSVRITSAGPNQPSKVVSQSFGSCPDTASAVEPVAPRAPARPVAPAAKVPATDRGKAVDLRRTV
ncbi:MAG: hypothetical protein ACM3YM_09735 [Sphingomonadales bacterium]